MGVDAIWALVKLFLSDPRRVARIAKVAARVRSMSPTALRLASAMYEANQTRELTLRKSRLANIKKMDREAWERLLSLDRGKMIEAGARMKSIREDARWLRDESVALGIDLGKTLLEK